MKRRWDQMTFLFAPKGPKQSVQPRATPWESGDNPPPSPERAKRRRHHQDLRVYRPFRACGGCKLPFPYSLPRALPWANFLGPFGRRLPKAVLPPRFRGGGWSRDSMAFPVAWAYLVKMARRLIRLGPFGVSSSQGGSPTEVSRRGLVARFHAFPVAWAYLVKMARRTTLARGGVLHLLQSWVARRCLPRIPTTLVCCGSPAFRLI